MGKRNYFITILILMFIFTGCYKTSEEKPYQWIEIPGRDSQGDEAFTRYPVYRAKVPKTWKPIYPPSDSSNINTTLPIISFDLGSVKLHVHNFPSERIEQRIPPQAQVHRWERQFTEIHPYSIQVKQVSHAGFVGLYFQAEGKIGSKEQMMIGWAMSIDPHHYSRLIHEGTKKEKEFYKQLRADYTIKVVGDRDKVAPRLEKIRAFGNSFELIQEIPH